MTAEKLRRLPAIGRLLDHPRLSLACEVYGRDAVRVQARRTVDAWRARWGAEHGFDERGVDEGGDGGNGLLEEITVEVAGALEAELGGLRRVINATGILLHTNLGRAPLPASIGEELSGIVHGYCDLEIDLESGRRAERNAHVGRLLGALCGAEAALVANNNAAAMILALATLAAGREVLIARGELVEIGGSFRLPAILEAAGCRLREVGSTNRTRLADYARAIGPETALLLKVFPSNYRISGFVESTPASALAELGRAHGLPVLVDEGSGLLRPSTHAPLRGHPSFSELLADGCNLVCGSGDKVLGGPQAGLLAGRAELIERCRRHPLYRALRPDRYTYAALGLVLRRHLAGGELPLDRLFDHAALDRRLGAALATLPAERATGDAYLGGGSAPDQAIPGPVLALADADGAVHRRLRLGLGGRPPVVGRVHEGRLLIDLRTVDPADDGTLRDAVLAALAPLAPDAARPEPA